MDQVSHLAFIPPFSSTKVVQLNSEHIQLKKKSTCTRTLRKDLLDYFQFQGDIVSTDTSLAAIERESVNLQVLVSPPETAQWFEATLDNYQC